MTTNKLTSSQASSHILQYKNTNKHENTQIITKLCPFVVPGKFALCHPILNTGMKAKRTKETKTYTSATFDKTSLGGGTTHSLLHLNVESGPVTNGHVVCKWGGHYPRRECVDIESSHLGKNVETYEWSSCNIT